jgi:hypothetical protein
MRVQGGEGGEGALELVRPEERRHLARLERLLERAHDRPLQQSADGEADDEEDDRVRQRQAGVQQSMADQRADADDDGRPDDRLVHVRVQLSVREGQLGTLLVHALQ